jgi:hypothetical protein
MLNTKLFEGIPVDIVLTIKQPNDSAQYMSTQLEYNVGRTLRTFHIHIWSPTTRSNAFYMDMIRKMQSWLNIACTLVPDLTCSTTVHVYVFLTSCKKQLPKLGATFEQINLNSAFTYACNGSETSMHIFREEEWFKVFIHETFHCLGLDFVPLLMQNHTLNDSCNKRIHQVLSSIKPKGFETKSDVATIPDYKIYELYVEIWADIIHTLYEVNPNLHITRLNKERRFSVYQASKILNHLSLKYTNIMGTGTGKVESVFSYHIGRSIVFSELNLFLRFCIENNSRGRRPSLQICRFVNNTEAISAFIEQVVVKSASIDRLQILESYRKRMPIIKNNTLRMTITNSKQLCGRTGLTFKTRKLLNNL